MIEDLPRWMMTNKEKLAAKAEKQHMLLVVLMNSTQEKQPRPVEKEDKTARLITTRAVIEVVAKQWLNVAAKVVKNNL